MFKNKLLVSSLLIALSTPLMAEIDKTIVASVDGRDIITEELIIAAKQNKVEYAVLNEQQKNKLLQGIINRVALSNQAKRLKMGQEPETILLINSITESLLSQSLLKQKINEIEITEAEIKAHYEKNIKTNVQKEYSARHILLKEENQAKELMLQLASADVNKFAQVAKEKSTGPSAKEGGYLGWFKPEGMVPSFAKAVKEATKGKVTGPVKSQFGWHIIFVEDEKIIEPDSLEKSKAKIKEALMNEKMPPIINAYMDGVLKNAKIDIKKAK
jgi:peptidyl-prolyl cis-trans isomerase C